MGHRFYISYYCPHHKEGSVPIYAVDCECRKPKPGMINQAIKDYDVDPKSSFLIGDSQRDVDAAEAGWCKRLSIYRYKFVRFY